MTTNETATIACVCCKVSVTDAEMSTSPVWKGWCNKCMEREIEACRRDEENDRDGWDDVDEYGPGGAFEDPYAAYERERGEAFQDRLDMWRREY